MNIDIIKCVINNDYLALSNITNGKNSNLDKFYNLYASFYIHKSKDLFSFLENTTFSKEEAQEIYDVLEQKSDLKEARSSFLDKYKDYINTKNVYTDKEVVALASKIKLPNPKRKVDDITKPAGAIVFLFGIVALMIFSMLAWKLNEEIVYFSTILLLVVPCLLLVLGINLVFTKKLNYLLIALETFLLIYFVSFACLYPQMESTNFFVNIKNHFYEVIKAIYSFFKYYTFKALEV